MDFDFPKIAASPLTAGAFGSMIGLKFIPGLLWIDRFANFCSGMACSIYVAPIISEVLGLTTIPKQNGLAFLMGLFSVSITAAIIDGIRNVKVADIIDSWAKRGGGK